MQKDAELKEENSCALSDYDYMGQWGKKGDLIDQSRWGTTVIKYFSQ
jgi:hypothetical protein